MKLCNKISILAITENTPFKTSDNNRDLVFFCNTYKGLLLLSTGWESGTISNASSKDINLVSITINNILIMLLLAMTAILLLQLFCINYYYKINGQN